MNAIELKTHVNTGIFELRKRVIIELEKWVRENNTYIVSRLLTPESERDESFDNYCKKILNALDDCRLKVDNLIK